MFHAVISSPLGDILLTADERHLVGLHFTNQRDCPHIQGLDNTTDETISQPSAGTIKGQPLRALKAFSASQATENRELFATQDLAPTSVNIDPAAMSLRLLQDATPTAVLAIFQQTQTELTEYWRGQRQVFDIALAPQGSVFQKKIWRALLAVPCGATLSYGQLGEHAGLGAGHGRAVGTAVGSNPISIIIPCHRILAHDRALNGYGGGLGRKIHLLQLEGLVVR